MPPLAGRLTPRGWQPQQMRQVPLGQGSEEERVRIIAARAVMVAWSGCGMNPKRLDHHGRCDGEAVVRVVADLRFAHLAAAGFHRNANAGGPAC